MRVTSKDYDARTPLHIAAAKGNADIIKFLLESGASVHAVDRTVMLRCHVDVCPQSLVTLDWRCVTFGERKLCCLSHQRCKIKNEIISDERYSSLHLLCFFFRVYVTYATVVIAIQLYVYHGGKVAQTTKT